MKISETLKDGLKREYNITVPLNDLDKAVEDKLEGIRGQAVIKGFRPGKVPLAHLKKVYGKSVMAEVIDDKIKQCTEKLANDNNFRYASRPDIKLPEDQEEVRKMLEGEKDFAFSMSFEVLPEIASPDLGKIKINAPEFKVEDSEVKEALGEIAAANKPYVKKEKGAAEEGDKLIIDFVGSIDGVEFQGGAAEDAELVIGSGRFIPGFEEGLIGAKNEEKRDINVTFPEDYGAKDLAGKEAVFAITVKEIEMPGEAKLDDELAKNFGFDDLNGLEDATRERLQSEYDSVVRLKTKRALFDELNEKIDFELPQSLLDQEIDLLKKSNEHAPNDDEKQSDEEINALASRRVKLGLLLAEVGKEQNIQVSDTELQKAVIARARQYPGQESRVIEYFKSNPQALHEVRAPLFEDKVVDYLLEQISVTRKTVTKDELMRDDDAAEETKASDKKKPAAKKATDSSEAPAEKKKTAAKKAPAKASKKKSDS